MRCSSALLLVLAIGVDLIHCECNFMLLLASVSLVSSSYGPFLLDSFLISYTERTTIERNIQPNLIFRWPQQD